mgnify:CR=1 FL=1
MGGQHMLEQTFLLDVEHLRHPETSPLRTLERLLHRPLRLARRVPVAQRIRTRRAGRRTHACA